MNIQVVALQRYPAGRGGNSPAVMAGLVPAIHDVNTAVSRQVVDARHEAGHDD
jgi:hypothetical protein